MTADTYLLAPADLEVLGVQEEGMAAELRHPGLKRHPGAGRGLLKDHGQGFTGKELVRPAFPPEHLEPDRIIDKRREIAFR
jgi:hypothetical protein